MNKRRRHQAKSIRRWFGGVRSGPRLPIIYPTCVICGEYLMVCTCSAELIDGAYMSRNEMLLVSPAGNVHVPPPLVRPAVEAAKKNLGNIQRRTM